MQVCFAKTSALPPSQGNFSSIRGAVSSLLSRCNISYPREPPSSEFQAACWAEATRRGYMLDLIGPAMPAGVAIGGLTYLHLPNEATKIFIALFTAYMVYLDDCCHDHIEGLSSFSQNVMQKRPHNHKVLNEFSDLFNEIFDHWTPIVAHFISVSSLNFVASMVLDKKMENTKIHTSAKEFPRFMRRMSGAPQVFALFIFPKDLPVASYLQCLQDIQDWINHVNDVLSFYKEELVEENQNYISLMSQMHATTKIKEVQRVIEEAVEAHERILTILRPNEAAYDAYVSFIYGYVGFHTTITRYRLDELAL